MSLSVTDKASLFHGSESTYVTYVPTNIRESVDKGDRIFYHHTRHAHEPESDSHTAGLLVAVTARVTLRVRLIQQCVMFYNKLEFRMLYFRSVQIILLITNCLYAYVYY